MSTSTPEVVTANETIVELHRGVGTIRASQPQARPGDKPKRPKVTEGERICEKSGCSTKLSIYNSQPMCHQHRPIRFPRVRGRQS